MVPQMNLAGGMKQEVVRIVQRHLGRPTTKEDIVWSCTPCDGRFVGMVSIRSIGLSAESWPCQNKKEAESQAAAEMLPQLLNVCGPSPAKKAKVGNIIPPTQFAIPETPAQLFAAWAGGGLTRPGGPLAQRIPVGPLGQVRPPARQTVVPPTNFTNMVSSWGSGAPAVASHTTNSVTPLFEVKRKIFYIVQKSLGRPHTKQDVLWETQIVDGSKKQTTLSIPHLELIVQGAPAVDEKSAQLSAGEVMLPLLEAVKAQFGIFDKTVKQAVIAQTLTQVALNPMKRKRAADDVAPRGDNCPWQHFDDAPIPALMPTGPTAKKAKIATIVDVQEKANQQAKKLAAQAEWEEWRSHRLDLGTDPDSANVQSFDLWYAQVCLCCLCVCPLDTWPTHKAGANHLKKYREMGGASLKDGFVRPEPYIEGHAPEKQLSMAEQRAKGLDKKVLVGQCDEAEIARFAKCAGFTHGRILSLGEQDFSFTLGIARLQRQAGQVVRLVGSSYLAEHDPNEPEVHVADDGERARYSRRSLPSMAGALFQNLEAIRDLGGACCHSVDATDLAGTMLSQGVTGKFDVVVFPFPRASLQRAPDPNNSKLLRGFFWSVIDAGVLAPRGTVQLLMLATQYAQWDVACMALESGFTLRERVPLPLGFYQSREMSGKAWTPLNGELYVFHQPMQAQYNAQWSDNGW